MRLLILLSQFEGLGGAAAITGMWSLWHLVAGVALVGLFRALDWRTLKPSLKHAPERGAG